MGNGIFSEAAYNSNSATRAAQGVDDFAYTQTATRIHESLDPKRIHDKPFHLLESRDNDGRISTPIILTFDVTGSNERNARIAQKELAKLMGQVTAVMDNPQIAIWTNDDVKVQFNNSIQLGEFESDNRIDESLRNIWITGDGGGNGGESYDLLIYAAARKVITDAWEKRHKKGYMFLYADEPFFTQVDRGAVKLVFDDGIEQNISLAEIIAEAQQKWEIHVIWPLGGQQRARAQYVELFGDQYVHTLEDAHQLCELVSTLTTQEETKYKAAQNELTLNAGDYVDRQA